MLPGDPFDRYQRRIGQDAPATREYQRMLHGRYLSGFGEDAPALGPSGQDPGYESSEMSEMEDADDVFGSGIFDEPGRPTSNNTMGIFASEYGLPGYVAREVPYAVSKDVTDVANGGAVVFIPAGGYYHIEDDGRVVPHPVLGPTPRPPANVPAPLTMMTDPYVNIQQGPERDDLNAGYPNIPMPSYQPRRAAYPPIDRVADYPMARVVPDEDNWQSLPHGNVDEQFNAGVPVGTGAYMVRRPRRGAGLGEASSTASTVGLVIGCAVLGTVVGMVASAVSGSPRSR
jgi:hypothetical protein